MLDAAMSQVLLVGRDWQTRALLRAQLIEEGIDVEAHESVESAVAAIEGGDFVPALILADLTASDDPIRDADQWAAWTQPFAIWVIASRTLITSQCLKGKGFELVLFRPIDVGELVEQIKMKLQG